MNAQAVLKKMQVKASMRLLVLNAPESLRMDLQAGAGDVQVAFGLESENPAGSYPAGTFPAVLLFVQSQAELAQHAPAAIQAVAYDGLLWIAYPKRTSQIKTDIYRDQGWDPVYSAGFSTVTQIALDETWSALRFRPGERVGK